MNWEAANAPKPQANGRSSELASDKRRSTETVEAALSRLSKAYTTSMECIGSLNKADKMILKEKSNREDAMAILVRVSNAARTTFEKAILTDPLVQKHAPTLYGEFLEMKRPTSISDKRPAPPLLSSAAHKATVRELSYLSLVNYSDLLQTCSSSHGSYSNDNVLDRGVVGKLKSLNGTSCWNDESVEDSQRLALAALCDASNLDPSDPLVWLKLASVARNLERTVHLRNDSVLLISKYRRIQRYALERGSTVLPPNMPPNRAITRALRELDAATTGLEEYETRPASTNEGPVEMFLELPRYSWSVFGRMLVRTCKEGTGSRARPSHVAKPHPQFGSPVIRLRINPMFVLPPKVLGRICGFLDMKSVLQFECTCRFALLSARASTDTDADNDNAADETRQIESQNQIDTTDEKMDDLKTPAAEKPDENESGKGEKTQMQSYRTSKRLRSQMITSGKIAERSANRKSFEYCFLAATQACSKTEYNRILKEAEANALARQNTQSAAKRESALRSNSYDAYRQEAHERLSSASLGAFVATWNGRNSGPMDLLRKFLVHVAMNVQEVFSSDPRGPLELTSCILTAFDLCLHRSGTQQGISPQFFEPIEKSGSIRTSLELFAVDLLYCELILKQCERHVPTHVEFDDDSNMITLMVVALLDARSQLHHAVKRDIAIESKLQETFINLCIRCNWVAAGMFLWRSRITRVIFEAREAEDEGVCFINETVRMFDSPIVQSRSIQTPHLLCPGRTETHWKEITPVLLERFRDEIQASSVVSLAKQKFQEFIDDIDQSRIEIALGPVPTASAKILADIGERLLERYKSSHSDPGAKHIELVEDFLTVHGGDLRALIRETDQEKVEKLSDPVPIQALEIQDIPRVSSPSTLTILATCLNVVKGYNFQMIQLLVRVLLAAIDLHGTMIGTNPSKSGKGDEHYNNYSDSDDDSSISGDGSDYRSGVNTDADETRIQNCGHLVILLLERIHGMFSEGLDDAEKMQFTTSDDCISMISHTIEFSKTWFNGIGRRRSLADDTTEVWLLKGVLRVVESLRSGTPQSRLRYINRVCFVGLVETVILHSPLLLSLARAQGNRVGKSARQKLCLRSARLLAVTFSELGFILSENLGQVKHLRMFESDLLSGGVAKSSVNEPVRLSSEQKALFSDAVLSLWRYASRALGEDGVAHDSTLVCSSFDRPIVRLLQIPMASTIVGFCGSATRTRTIRSSKQNQEREDPLCLTEFFDSDASANEWLTDGEDSGPNESKPEKKELLRVICHAIHCVNAVLGVTPDKGAVSTFVARESERVKLGPLLPLVTTRVLNYYADSLLTNFAQDGTQKGALWVDTYPYTTRTIGELLDSLLHKAYSWLFGFSLVGEKAHQSAGKDSGSSTTATTSDIHSRNFQPEDATSAAQLYRCIVRAYAGGRRSPPKGALEVVSAALPPLEESETSSVLREFMFCFHDGSLGLEGVTDLIEKREGWTSPFREIESHFMQSGVEEDIESDESQMADEIMRVRRGISSELASGQVPMASMDSGHKGKADSITDDERLTSSKHEEELSKKFFAIVDDLCLGDARNAVSWYRAAQCLILKADLIADRLGLSKGFCRSADFSIPSSRPPRKTKLPVAALTREQELEDSLLRASCIPWIGKDLSVYARHTWSSFASLMACSIEISEQERDELGTTSGKERVESLALKEIGAMHTSGDYLKWQESWGGIFVSALQKLALHFMCTALYLVQSKEKPEADDRIMMSEICEMIGVAVYSELMASQGYGYPMHVMGKKRKRQIAIVAKKCFQCAVDIVHGTGEDDDSENRETWDLIFMVGKCDEKIAGTYSQETFSESSRKYEENMASALQHYSSALEQAEDIENDGGFVVGQQGGSSHGSTEVLYRLQACRLKCLVAAVSEDEGEIEAAEAEALRLTEAHWFKKPDERDAAGASATTRDRVWNVFTDIVAGLAKCRLDHHFYHRSVYRHAQALMWAPLLCDPTSTEGSLGMVPATRSYTIRGLNNSTNAATSAEVVMSSLFDKKRPQLCAAWMTTTATSSPFQLLNNSSRKYDSLRGKYIAAYIESLRLCNRRPELEQFMKLLASSKRDLPNYFQASALVGGGAPPKGHARENLLETGRTLMSSGFLVTAKRQGNSAIAEFILKSLSDKDADGNKKAESNLKQAYACYLRLHCSEDELKKTRAMKYGVGTIPEVEALCNAYLMTDYAKPSRIASNDWSGGARKSSIFDAALEKCRSLFPTASGNFLFKNLGKSKEKETLDASAASKKRKNLGDDSQSTAAKSSKVSFEVSVPDNLVAGDTFLTTVKFGESSTKKVKLTVPEGNPATLRFSLKVPTTGKET